MHEIHDMVPRSNFETKSKPIETLFQRSISKVKSLLDNFLTLQLDDMVPLQREHIFQATFSWHDQLSWTKLFCFWIHIFSSLITLQRCHFQTATCWSRRLLRKNDQIENANPSVSVPIQQELDNGAENLSIAEKKRSVLPGTNSLINLGEISLQNFLQYYEH